MFFLNKKKRFIDVPNYLNHKHLFRTWIYSYQRLFLAVYLRDTCYFHPQK